MKVEKSPVDINHHLGYFVILKNCGAVDVIYCENSIG